MPTAFAPPDPPYFVEGFAELNRDVAVLASACADAVYKSVQHFGSEAWSIGTLPQCETIAGVAEVRAKTLIIAPQTTGPLIDRVSEVLKNTDYLRAVARAARQNVQLAWLLKNDTQVLPLFPLMEALGAAASDVASETAAALNANGNLKASAARRAALLFRNVETARKNAEIGLRSSALPEPSARMTRAAMWFMVIAGENMARVAARAASENRPV